MKAFALSRSSGHPFLSRTTFLRSRTQVLVPQKLFFSRAKYSESGLDGSFSVRVVPQTLLAAEKEEAKAVLSLFLKKLGLSSVLAARTINKSDGFIDHLLSQLHSVHKSRYLVGRELTTLEIRDALNPYLETLLEEYGSILVEFVENFPNHPSPVKKNTKEIVQKQPLIETSAKSVSTSISALNSKKLKALARVSDISPTGKLPPHIVYLLELGMEIEAIREVTRKFPAFAYYSLDGKIKPVVEFLLDLGVPKVDIPGILSKRPQLCGISLTENLIPTMEYLEELGVDKKQWAKVIHRFPPLLTYSRSKLKSTVDFLYEKGLSAENVGKLITRCPNIISYSVEEKLRPTAEYFESLEVNVALLLQRSPQTFGLSIEANLKPVTRFFLDRGYSLGDVTTMISRYGTLYTFSLSDNMTPKWDFFVTTVYPKSELIKFPQYFGYSLEDRIKPRYEIMRKHSIKLLLNQMLSLSEQDYHTLLKKKMQKMVGE
ncbi:transcription termination factor MTERF5, chloroplastic-like [Primulina eburnea]|uniref:transcription termination factor MTERF5, chloroplastic-like n=1 Tax=Primulina eburnea TaxID=1245227 RepID=UPI003C6C3BF5